MTHARRRRFASPVAIIGAMLALSLATSGEAAKKLKAAGCDLGWFVSDGDALLTDSAATARPRPTGSESVRGRVVSLVGEEVSIEGMCPRTRARMTPGRRRTKLRASWKGCLGVTGPVELKASIRGDDCRIMQGRVQTKQAKPKRRRFTATRALGDPRDCTAEDTFAIIQKRIFGPKGCRVATCHGEFKAGGLDLRLGAAHASLVDQPATTVAAAGALRVAPGDPDASFLWRKVTGALEPGEGSPMPAAGASPLDALELELVRAWIADGAPPVGRVAEAPCLPHQEFEPAAPLPPPPGGHQLVLEGPVLQPGEEMEGCIWVMAPNTSPFPVGKWEYSMNPGSHHFALWDHFRGPIPTLDTFDPKDTACLRGGARMDGVTLSGSPEAPYFVDAYPTGAGNTLEANKIVGLNPHYFNEFEVPIQVKVWINLHPVDGPFQHEVETLFSSIALLDGKSAYSIFVDPFATAALKLRMTNTLGRPMHIFNMSSHQHQRGTHFMAWDAAGAKVFENFDWAHPNILSFDPPYTLAPGDHLDFECQWDNGITRAVRRCGDAVSDRNCTPGDPRPVTFGVTAQDEMCYLTGFYYTD
jgi:hypothetical protein